MKKHKYHVDIASWVGVDNSWPILCKDSEILQCFNEVELAAGLENSNHPPKNGLSYLNIIWPLIILPH